MVMMSFRMARIISRGRSNSQRKIQFVHGESYKRDSLFRKKVAKQLALFFILDAGEHFGAQRLDRFRTVEWQPLVHDSTTEVARLAAGFQHGLNLCGEVHLLTRR
jgi:hypothetical protein